MYSPKVIAARQSALESLHSRSLDRTPLGEIDDWIAHLDRRRRELADAESLKLDDINSSNYRRYLRPEEADWIDGQVLLCSIDFLYWCERFCMIIRDAEVGGGLARLVPWGPQRILLDRIARMEEEQTDAWERGESVNGILIALHKARQLGATMLARALTMHRLTTSAQTLAATASVDDDKILLIQERDNRILDNLPWWLQPHKGYAEKGLHLYFDKLDSKLQYQTLVQKSGIAQGEQYILGHISEAASDPYGGFLLTNHYFPAIPRAPWVLHIMESTAQGRDNWWRFFIEETRKGLSRWRMVFIPWYAEPRKYRLTPPPDWKPSKDALMHAMKVHDTSEEFVGKKVMLPRENLYWYEFNRADALRQGKLNYFLANYCATPEESFQHTGESVFADDLLAFYRNQTRVPEAYEFAL